MNQQIFNYLKSYSQEVWDINKLLTSAYIMMNKIKIVNNLFIKSYLIQTNDEDFLKLNEFVDLLEKNSSSLDIESLIELFEFVISPQDKEVNGAIFTPKYIRDYIVQCSVKQFNKDIDKAKFGDIACGCGGFFKTIVDLLRQKTNKSYYDIFKDNIYGLDIQGYSIKRTKILLSLIAITEGEDPLNFDFNLYEGNALNFDWNTISDIKNNGGFDIIVGNPPYVSSSRLDENSKKMISKWSVSKSGKVDLYIPFFEIGLENLNTQGVLGYITVNTFYKSVNGRAVRNYFSKNQFDLSIIDFGGEQLFKKRSTYTCICIIAKSKNTKVKYVKTKSDKLSCLKKKHFITIPYSKLDDKEGWYLINNEVQKKISLIESTGIPLGQKFDIRNGFATLKNNIYVFKPVKETVKYFFLKQDDIEYKIEKAICRDVIKPNTLKEETEIEDSIEKLIFPYKITDSNGDLFSYKESKTEILEESFFKKEYPNAYKYLMRNKEILGTRDKGQRTYEAWYAYGRNQALTLKGYKLFFPYMSNSSCFVFSDKKDLLFYNGYAIISDSKEELYLLQKILKSKFFWFYIEKTSKPYSGNYFSLAKNYIKKFGVCSLSDAEKKHLLKIEDINEIDIFLENKYNITDQF